MIEKLEAHGILYLTPALTPLTPSFILGALVELSLFPSVQPLGISELSL